jgi:hypothetical protein
MVSCRQRMGDRRQQRSSPRFSTTFLKEPSCTPLKYLAAMAACSLFATSASAQSAKDIRGASPLVAIEHEAPAKLIVDPLLPESLALGRVFIQYRTENLRVVPVFGKGAPDVSPRIGHIHITVDDAPWHSADAGGETVKFTVPDPKTPKSHNHSL